MNFVSGNPTYARSAAAAIRNVKLPASGMFALKHNMGVWQGRGYGAVHLVGPQKECSLEGSIGSDGMAAVHVAVAGTGGVQGLARPGD